MANLNAALAAFGDAMQAVRPVEMFYANCGRRRAFLSPNDARAYEAGYDLFPAPLPLAVIGPRFDGWRDAEDEINEQLYQLRNPQTRPTPVREAP